MAVDTNISMDAAKAGLDAVVDRAENGTGANCRVRVYSGAKPATPDDAPTGSLLVEVDLGASTPIFGAAATGTGGETNSAVATASGVLTKTGTATASGTMAWFRAVDKGTNAFIDGTVGTSSSDMIVDNTSINNGQKLQLKTWKIKLSRGS